MSSPQAQLGKTVRRLREEAGFSQEGFADHCRLHRTYMGAIERGERNVSLEMMQKIAKGLNMRASDLLKAAGL